MINVDISMKAISNVFIKTADTLLVFIICYFKILYKSDNSIWIIAIKIAHLKKKRFLLTLHYPIRNWFSEIRKINSVITALKFQRPNFTCTGRNCIYVIMKVKTLKCETKFTSLEIYLNKRPQSMGSYSRNVQPLSLIVCRKFKVKTIDGYYSRGDFRDNFHTSISMGFGFLVFFWFFFFTISNISTNVKW